MIYIATQLVKVYSRLPQKDYKRLERAAAREGVSLMAFSANALLARINQSEGRAKRSKSKKEAASE